MNKSIKIISIISAITGLAYIVSSVLFGIICVALFIEGDYNISKIIPSIVFNNLLPSVITFAVKLAAMFYLLSEIRKNAKSIVWETVFIVYLSAASSLFSIIFKLVYSGYLNKIIETSSDVFAYNYLTSGFSFTGTLLAISNALMIIALAFSICRKKYLLSKEVTSY